MNKQCCKLQYPATVEFGAHNMNRMKAVWKLLMKRLKRLKRYAKWDEQLAEHVIKKLNSWMGDDSGGGVVTIMMRSSKRKTENYVRILLFDQWRRFNLLPWTFYIFKYYHKIKDLKRSPMPNVHLLTAKKFPIRKAKWASISEFLNRSEFVSCSFQFHIRFPTWLHGR